MKRYMGRKRNQKNQKLKNLKEIKKEKTKMKMILTEIFFGIATAENETIAGGLNLHKW